MPSLIGCIGKAGEYLSAEDKAAINARYRELRKEGLDDASASKQAVRDQLENVGKLEKEYKPGQSTKAAEPPEPTNQLEALAMERPDLQVILPGSDKAVPIAEAMERIKADANEEAGFAKLIEAAANCAVSFGA